METPREHLWRQKPIFNSNEMLEFAKFMSPKIMSNFGAYEVTIEDLGEFVKKKRNANKSVPLA